MYDRSPPRLASELSILRRTKIVATLGPATDDPAVLRALLQAGADVVRINFSHGRIEDHLHRVKLVRELAAQLGRNVAILADLQGPKIRVESFKSGSVTLLEGASFTLDTTLARNEGDEFAVGCSYLPLPHEVVPDDVLLLNDGAIALRVHTVDGARVNCRVEQGGVLSGRKGINKLGGGLSAEALTDEDREHIVHAANWDCDFIAISFPRSGADMHEARRLVREAGGQALLVAKIERSEALDNLEEIVLASDAVMVARGDLGVEIGDAALPGWQKRIIAAGRGANKMVITATQMMESMITSPIPTRAEVLDVANAVMDGTDAVMLSAETATGRYPAKVVETMARIVLGAESHPVEEVEITRGQARNKRIDEALAISAAWTARCMDAKAILALTETGTSAMMMSRVEREIAIYALTRHDRTLRRMSLCRGVVPIPFAPSSLESVTATQEAVDALQARGLLQLGDRVLVTKGDGTGPGGTNSMKIVTVR